MDSHEKLEEPKPKPETNHPLNPSWRNPWVIICAAFLLLILLAAATAVHRVATVVAMGPTQRKITMMPGGPGVGYRQFVQPNGSQLQGVVTVVNGDKLTIAGNGTTSTVTTTSSTQYVGASSAAVDDTVDVMGTSSNGTLTATQIVVNP